MRVAVEGCSHGELDKIYEHISQLERRNGYQVELLLLCGDFQAVRNHSDLQCMSVPPKYRKLGGFHKYYTGEKVAPMLTIVIGGNHEASNYFWELYHGGWIAPKIYYLGASGCVTVNGLRIAGASGIFNEPHFRWGNWEKLPYDDGAMRSIYHTRQYCMFKLAQLASLPASIPSSPIDIFLSHDWPQHVVYHGDVEKLVKMKPFFKQDIQSGKLGNPPLMQLLKTLRPHRWFAAHLHVMFKAVVKHDGSSDPAVPPTVAGRPPAGGDNPDEIAIDDDMTGDVDVNPDEIAIDLDEDAPSGAQRSGDGTGEEPQTPAQPPLDSKPSPPPFGAPETHFLALDKCLPGRQFLEVLDIPTPTEASPPTFAFDQHWLAVTRALHPFLSLTRQQTPLPSPEVAAAMVAKELAWVQENVSDLEIEATQKFAITASGPVPKGVKPSNRQPPAFLNPQTEGFCSMLGIENKINEDGLRISFGARTHLPPVTLPATAAGEAAVENPTSIQAADPHQSTPATMTSTSASSLGTETTQAASSDHAGGDALPGADPSASPH